MAGRRVQNEDEARRFLKSVDDSGLARGAWARAHGIDGRSLQAWHLIFERRKGSSSRPLRILELVPTQSASHGTGVVLRLGDATIDVPPAVDDTLLRRLLSAIAKC